MGEGWSVGLRNLIPSNAPTNHPDPRMHWMIGIDIGGFGLAYPSTGYDANCAPTAPELTHEQ